MPNVRWVQLSHGLLVVSSERPDVTNSMVNHDIKEIMALAKYGKKAVVA